MKVYLYYILTGAFRSRSAPEVVVIRLRFRGCGEIRLFFALNGMLTPALTVKLTSRWLRQPPLRGFYRYIIGALRSIQG